ncbi:MAG: ABC transporter permease, partial [Gammaproteobacteria bacterium]|nr:ABC transporter permease [Gammaproteobacteria bacterium]
LAGLMTVLLLGVAFASISNGLAIMLQREEPLVMIGNLMTLPLMFFSTAMVPQQFMPSWLHYATLVNPVEYGVQAARAATQAMPDVATFWPAAGVTTVFAVATTAWAVNAFRALRD